MGTPCTNCIDVTKLSKTTGCSTIKSDNVLYSGPNLACSTINTNDTLTLAIQKINGLLCSVSGGQNLQTTLTIGNTAEDIGAIFTSIINPSFYTEILSSSVTSPAFIKIDGLPTQYLMADGSVSDITSFITQVITDGNTTQAPSSDAVFDALALKANDDNVIHKTFDETKTGQLTVQPVDTSINAIRGITVDGAGVFGSSDNAFGVLGISSINIGVGGQSPIVGVQGVSSLGVGVSGQSTDGIGTQGLSSTGIAVKAASTVGISLVADNVAGPIIASFRFNGAEVSSISLSGVNTSNSFVKSGGTNLQYLMADGTISTLANIVTDLIVQTITNGDTTHAPSSDAVFDALAAVTAGSLFNADIPVVLSGVKTLGKYTNGQTIPAIGKTAQQVITDIALEYINPSFSAFSVTGQATTVETGTTLTGSKTFTWTLNANSGVVPTIDLYDNTASSTLLAGTPNDGTQGQIITTIQLNTDGATQSWKGIANNTSPPGTVNSGNFVVTSRFVRWWGAVASYPVNPVDGAANRTYALALPSSGFKTAGVNTFTLVTGIVQIRFIVLLPPGVTITSVIDQTNANTDITASYILSAITINDIGGTARSYNMYQYTNAIPYTVSANHFITTT
jgi:hypothetical protein